MKGLFYGGPGNLSDGSSLVTGHWGPKFGDGDVIGMRVEHSGNSTVVAFSKNGAGLGTAFNLQGWDKGSSMCPAVSMDTAGQKVSITKVAMPDLAAMQDSSSRPADQVEGTWQGKFRCDISKEGEDKWRVSAQAGNNMSCLVEMEAGKLKVGPVMSTRMMPPPELQELEREVTGMCYFIGYCN